MDFRKLQHDFAAHLRDPSACPPPAGVEDRRLQIYRDLFLNNVSSLLASTFPVLQQILGQASWRRLIRDFYSSHRCHTPRFLEVAEEFLDYLRDERGQRSDDPAFLAELAHYEWIELALTIDVREPGELAVDRDGDLLEGRPVLSPLACPLVYRFPVHRLSPEYQPTVAPEQPSFYVVYRDLTDAVGFLEVNAVTMRLLERLEQSPQLTGRQQLEALAQELGHEAPEVVVAGGRETLADLRRRDVILGTALD